MNKVLSLDGKRVYLSLNDLEFEYFMYHSEYK